MTEKFGDAFNFIFEMTKYELSIAPNYFTLGVRNEAGEIKWIEFFVQPNYSVTRTTRI